ncbi:MAG: PIN domain-containing protein, partial [Actinomycetota bacterium]
MADRLSFLDTNVLVYAHDTTDEYKHGVATNLLDELWATERAALSTQVLQEFYNAATRKFTPALSKQEARGLTIAYGQFPVIEVDLGLIAAAAQLDQDFQLQFWDALIVEAARRIGAARV